MPFVISVAGPDDAEALARLFRDNAFGCHCRYWHFDGSSRDWLERLAQSPEDNRRAMTTAIARDHESMRGLVARRPDGTLVGWMKLTPAPALGKLYGQRLYRGLPCFERDPAEVLTVGCMLVDAAERRKGVARALLRAAIELATQRGARFIEAFPRAETGVSDQALMLGPHALFAEQGFETVHDFSPYPVLRLELRRPPPGAARTHGDD